MVLPEGLQLQLVGSVDSAEDLRTFEPLEVGTAGRWLVQFQVEGDSLEIAASIEAQLTSVPTWPEFSSHTAVEGQVVSIAYYTTGYEPQIGRLISILIGIAIFAGLPILLYFVSEEFRGMINLMVMMVVMVLIMSLMKRVTSSMGVAPKELEPKVPKVEKPPFEQRVLDRIEGITSRVVSIKAMFVTSPSVAASEVLSSAGSLSSIASTIRSAPKTAMDSYAREKAKQKISDISRHLDEYESRLTSDQREKLDREQKLVQEILRGG